LIIIVLGDQGRKISVRGIDHAYTSLHLDGSQLTSLRVGIPKYNMFQSQTPWLLPCSLALMYQCVQEYYGNYIIVENTAILLNGGCRRPARLGREWYGRVGGYKDFINPVFCEESLIFFSNYLQSSDLLLSRSLMSEWS
jgi:hypothetical protein